MQEKTVIRKLVRRLKKCGFVFTEIFDGEVYIKIENKESNIVSAVFELDEAWIFVKKNGKGKAHWIQVVTGNQDPADMLCNWSFSNGDKDKFDATMNDFLDEIDQ